MEQYRNLVTQVLQRGTVTDNRTETHTLSSVNHHYTISLADGFPLLTTKNLGGSRWESLKAELLWYLSGQSHIRDLSEYTGIWEPWADDDGQLDTAYGRFWRQYPVPNTDHHKSGESWARAEGPHDWVTTEHTHPHTPFGDASADTATAETGESEGRESLPESDTDSEMTPVNPSHTAGESQDSPQSTVDQLRYVIETLRESPTSRRAVMTAWHPGNATVSTLPPCHLLAVFNINNGQLHCHLTQRSGDVAVGIPFNVASYSLLTRLIRLELNRTRDSDSHSQLAPGTFSHTIVDAHIYCGDAARANWYRDNRSLIRSSLDQPRPAQQTYADLSAHITDALPPQSDRQTDHIPGLLEQMSREPYSRPQLTVDCDRIDEVEMGDISLQSYDSWPAIRFATVE